MKNKSLDFCIVYCLNLVPDWLFMYMFSVNRYLCRYVIVTDVVKCPKLPHTVLHGKLLINVLLHYFSFKGKRRRIKRASIAWSRL